MAYAKTVCEEPTDGINKINFVWIGGKVSKAKIVNVETLCRQIKEYIATSDDRFLVNIWTDSNSFDIFSSEIQNCSAHSRGSLNFKVLLVNTLLENEPLEDKSIYEFYIDKKNYAAASDYLRVLAVQNQGGCYLDIGYESQSTELIAKDLQKPTKTANQKDQFYTYGSPSFHLEDVTYNNENVTAQNNFFAAPKNHEVLKLLKEEFSFKNKFFRKYRPLIEALYENCSTMPIVFSLVGQHAYDDLYFSLYKNNRDVFNTITYLNLSKNLPYSGSGSWIKHNSNCGVFLASLYDDFSDPDFQRKILNMDIDLAITKLEDNFRSLDIFSPYPTSRNKIAALSEKKEYGHWQLIEASRRIFMELLRNFRKNQNGNNFYVNKYDASYLEKLTRALRANKNYAMFDKSDFLAQLRNQYSYQSDKVETSYFAVVKLSDIKRLGIEVNLSLFVATPTEFDEARLSDKYFGIMINFVSPSGTYQQIFFPKVKVTPHLGQSIISAALPGIFTESLVSTLDDPAKEYSDQRQYVYTLTTSSKESIDRRIPILKILNSIHGLNVVSYSPIKDGYLLLLNEFVTNKDKLNFSIKGVKFNLKILPKSKQLSYLKRMNKIGVTKDD